MDREWLLVLIEVFILLFCKQMDTCNIVIHLRWKTCVCVVRNFPDQSRRRESSPQLGKYSPISLRLKLNVRDVEGTLQIYTGVCRHPAPLHWRKELAVFNFCSIPTHDKKAAREHKSYSAQRQESMRSAQRIRLHDIFHICKASVRKLHVVGHVSKLHDSAHHFCSW